MTPEQRAAAERLADDLQRFDGAERESLRDEAAALLRELAAEPVQESSPLAGTMAEQFLQVVASIWHDHPDYSIRQTLDALNAKFPAEPVQDTPPQRPPTPVGWSDTDWLAHLSTMPPIAYALRDTLYGTSKAGVLRFCAANEPGAFAVYASPPPQQRKPPREQITAAAKALCRQASIACNVDFDDNWKVYGDEYIADATAALNAAYGIGETP